MGGPVVENEHRSVGQQRTRGDHPLPLSTGQLPALLTHQSVPALREITYPMPEARAPERELDLGVARVGAREADILADAGREKMRVLAGDGDQPADVVLPVVAHIPSA